MNEDEEGEEVIDEQNWSWIHHFESIVYHEKNQDVDHKWVVERFVF